MKPETIEYIEKVLEADRDTAKNRLVNKIAAYEDPTHHPDVVNAINDLKKTQDRLEDFTEWWYAQEVEDDDE